MTDSTTIAASVARCRHGAPATNSSITAITMYTRPEPRSGWAITNIAGISAASITRAVVSRSRSARERSTSRAARATISSTLPSSEAWKEKNGKLIARCAPLLACPAPSTARMLTIRAP